MDNSSMTKYGIGLYCLGIGLAVIGAAKLPAEGQEWSDMLYLFNDGVILTLLGTVLWRFGLANQSKKKEEGQRTSFQILKDMGPILDDLYRSVDDLECYQLQEYVKILREQYLIPLGEARSEIVHRYGLEKSAELLVALSYGERILNRVYSAASDKHHDEAVSCVEEAYNAFQEIYRILKDLGVGKEKDLEEKT